MEKIIRFKPRVQEAKAVTPDKGEVAKAPGWGKRIDGPPIVQPWAKAAKKEPEYRDWDETPKKKEQPWFKHFYARWNRTV